MVGAQLCTSLGLGRVCSLLCWLIPAPQGAVGLGACTHGQEAAVLTCLLWQAACPKLP